jgi:hypothetical protein
MADHTHEHSHDHDHHHEGEGDTYFIDQLCLVGLSGAFGMICLCLWFWQSKMLGLMLGEQFHPYVLVSGFTLVALAGIRGAILWRQSRDPAFLHQHDHHHHDHEHDHAHDHAIQEKTPLHSVQALPAAACGHEHAPGETCAHEHHAHGGHGHHHDHDEADHDHGWAPWRYVVILVPIILFLLGLPNKGPTIQAAQAGVLISPEAEIYLSAIGLGDDIASQLVHVGVAYNQPDAGKGEYVEYKFLESLAGFADRRATWKNKVVEVRGQFAPYQGSDQIFMLARYKISCCANDAVQLNVPMISREPVRFELSQWVKVTGRVDFREGRNGSFYTVLLIAKASDVEKCNPDNNPYIQ